MHERGPQDAGASAGTILAGMLRLSADGLLAALDDMSDDELRARPHGLAPALWQVGQVALSDARLARRAGAAVDLPEAWSTLFSRGTSGEGDLPSRAEVIRLFREVNDRVLDLCAGDLARTVETAAGRTDTLGNRLAFHVFHRGYHYGKLMTLRALLGKPRLLG
ncbi:MAG: DinB family protein [Firmicutes bacterium]|nr:DinB family protein [Bacillota bacterium]